MRVGARKFVALQPVNPQPSSPSESDEQALTVRGHASRSIQADQDVEYVEAEIVDESSPSEVHASAQVERGEYFEPQYSTYVGTQTQYDAFSNLTRVNASGYFETSNRLAKYREPEQKSLDEYKAQILASARSSRV